MTATAAARSLRRRRGGAPEALVAAGVHPVLASVYAARGAEDPAELDLSLQALLSPAGLLNADLAACRLADAVDNGEKILVVGDFDADGATSCAVALRCLQALGASAVDYLVPNRFEFGYGLTPELVEVALERSPDLVVTVDNGIASHEGVVAAHSRGIAVIVTDHHLPGETLPDADVIVNPNQPGCGFPSKHLAGVGVIFYVMLALRRELRARGRFTRARREPRLVECLDLLALGTVADVVPLDRNNRILVAAGLERIRRGLACPGIDALLQLAGRDPQRCTASDLGFAVGPRLNAAGRLDDMAVGIECLLCDDSGRALELASRLDGLNRDRRGIERVMEQEALKLLGALSVGDEAVPPALALYEPGWHQGVIGILAARVRERVHRPVIAFADAGDGRLKGSARSIAGVHIRDILAAVDARNPGLIERFGGHAMAAGLSLGREALVPFRQALCREMSRAVDPALFEPVIDSDGPLAPESLSLELATLLRDAGPWGQHFPEPLFEGDFRVLQQRLLKERHLKLVLEPLTVPARPAAAVDAIAFNVDVEAWPDLTVTEVTAAYRLDVNHWRGREALQLKIEHLQVLSAGR